MGGNVRNLAFERRDRREADEPPFTLFLGSGAMLSPGQRNSEITAYFAGYGVELNSMSSGSERVEACLSFIENADVKTKDKILNWLLNAAAPAAGYVHLANLVVNGYFRILISSGFDTFIEQSLYDAGLWPSNLIIHCLSRDERPQKRRKLEAVHLVKLHGDPYAKDFWDTWMDVKCPAVTRSMVSEAMENDLIMVGYHSRDSLVNPFFEGKDGDLIYVNVDESSVPENVGNRLRMIIVEEYGTLNAFFGALANLLLYRPASRSVEQKVDTESGSVTGLTISSDIGGSVSVGSYVEKVDPTGISLGVPAKGFADFDEQDPDADRLESLRSQLAALQENYYKVQKQAAMYGRGNAPTSLKNQLRNMEEEMEQLSAEIGRLTDKEA